jgi:hypothetical protein
MAVPTEQVGFLNAFHHSRRKLGFESRWGHQASEWGDSRETFTFVTNAAASRSRRLPSGGSMVKRALVRLAALRLDPTFSAEQGIS